MNKWPIFILTTAFLISCSPSPLSQNEEITYLNKMMSSNNCSHTCWLGIEPGKTLDTSTVNEKLGDYYGSENVFMPKESSLVWYITDKELSPLFIEQGSITYVENNKIELITIMFQLNQIPVSEVFSKYGKPAVTIINIPTEDYPPCSYWKLMFPNSGLVLVGGGEEFGFVGTMYIDEPFIVGENTMNEDIYQSIDWDEHDKYCEKTHN